MRYLTSIVFFVCLGYVSAQEISYRDEMRSFVSEISAYAKESNSNFYIVPQNGIELIAVDGDLSQPLYMNYINAIDGHAQESLFFSHQFMSRLSQKRRSDYLIPYYSKTEVFRKTHSYHRLQLKSSQTKRICTKKRCTRICVLCCIK